MKKSMMMVMVALLLLVACQTSNTPLENKTDTLAKPPVAQSDRAQDLQKIRDLLRSDKYAEALAACDTAIASYGIDDFYGLKAQALQGSGQSEPALALLDEAITAGKGDKSRLLMEKHDILLTLNRFEEALTTVKAADDSKEKKSPWTCLTIAEDHMKLNQPQEALSALETAVERGFISQLSLLETEAFKPLLETDGFKTLTKKIAAKIGIGAPAKDFSLLDLQAQPLSLTALKGKVVLIDFWATWCPPCRAEMPNLKAYYAELKDKGFEIIGISLDKDRAALDKYLADNQITWKISYSGKMWQDETAALYGVNSIPSTWLIDKKGNLSHFELRGPELKAAIEKLL